MNDSDITTPTPPAGYKLVKGEDIKDRVPEGAMVWYFMEQRWNPTYFTSGQLGEVWRDDFYAIPDTNQNQPENPLIEVAKAAWSKSSALIGLKSIIEEAKSIVAGDRANDYGDVNESFTRIAALWSAYTGATITPWDVAQMMILLKVSRAKTSQKRDTLVDIIGYAECASALK